jgi:hypothetical protein
MTAKGQRRYGYLAPRPNKHLVGKVRCLEDICSVIEWNEKNDRWEPEQNLLAHVLWRAIKDITEPYTERWKIRERDAEIWFPILERWKASGLSKKRFCLENKICDKSFYLWAYRLGMEGKRKFTSSPLYNDWVSDAYEWIFSESEEPWSIRWLCEQLSESPDSLLRKIREEVPDDILSDEPRLDIT